MQVVSEVVLYLFHEGRALAQQRMFVAESDIDVMQTVKNVTD